MDEQNETKMREYIHIQCDSESKPFSFWEGNVSRVGKQTHFLTIGDNLSLSLSFSLMVTIGRHPATFAEEKMGIRAEQLSKREKK